MASNFGIAINKTSDGFGLKLAGDFDATSAYELIYAIKKLPEDIAKISIYTNGLKSIFPFGLDVFHRNMSPLDGESRENCVHRQQCVPVIPEEFLPDFYRIISGGIMAIYLGIDR